MYCIWRSDYHRSTVWDSIYRFNPAALLCLSVPGTGFSTSYVVLYFFLMFIELRREVAINFVDIGVIVDN